MIRFALIPVIAAVAASTSADDLIFVIEQDRYISGYAETFWPEEESDTQSAQAPDAELWVQSITASAGDPLNLPVVAGAGQYSAIAGELLSAYGIAEIRADSDQVGEVYGLGLAVNRYRVRFAVAETVEYSLSGYMSAYADATTLPCCTWFVSCGVAIRLDQIAGPTVFADEVVVALTEVDPEQLVSDDRTLNFTGTLEPGVYELDVIGTVEAPDLQVVTEPHQPMLAEVSFIVDLAFEPVAPEAPCVAVDTDGDSDVDMDDFWQFQQCFSGAE
jgi:hypothetical protein